MNINDKSVKTSYTERLAGSLPRNSSAAAPSKAAAVPGTREMSSAAMRSLSQGETVRGEVINRVGPDVQLKLEDGSVLRARMDSSIPLSIGQTASFEVSQAEQTSITLRLLPEAPMAEQNALIGKALQAAGLPENARNITVVEELLRHQLSIDKDSIHQLLQQSINHKNTDIGTLVLMNKYHLPVNTATITQFQAYQNYEHRMLPQLTSLLHTLGEMAEGGSASASSFLQQLQNLLGSGEGGGGINGTLIGNQAADGTIAASTGETFTGTNQASNSTGINGELLVSEQAGSNGTTASALTSEVLNGALSDGQATDNSASSHMTGEALTGADLASNTVGGINGESFASGQTGSNGTTSALAGETINGVLSFGQAGNGAAVSTAGEALLSGQTVVEATSSTREALANTNLALSTPGINGELLASNQAVLQAPLTAAMLETQLLRRWTLSPKELAKDASVKKFYQQLKVDLQSLEELLRNLESGTKAEKNAETQLNQATRLVQNLQDNLEFVNELNRIFPYFQLPVRFEDKTTHGELYVYTKKDSLKADQSSISVLLHLDMDHLGPTDIYLSLTNTSLASKFYVSDKQLQSLFQEHLPELKQTLADKGLEVSYEIMTREHEVNPIQDFLSADAPDSMKRYSFDCRA